MKVYEDISTPGMARSLGLDSAVTGAYDGAWRATSEDNLDEVHPIRYKIRHGKTSAVRRTILTLNMIS